MGTKTTLWVMSDWTCIKLINKYPKRLEPILICIPFKFMGKPYYHERPWTRRMLTLTNPNPT